MGTPSGVFAASDEQAFCQPGAEWEDRAPYRGGRHRYAYVGRAVTPGASAAGAISVPAARLAEVSRAGRRSSIHALLALGGLAACAGCAPATPPRAPDVVLVSIDSLRADRLGAYGASRDTSPAIDRLAAEGARFETVVAPTSWTLPSHVTLFTGLSISGHRVLGKLDRLDPERRTLAQHFANAGYRTAAFVSSPFLHRAFGFDRGFAVYRNFGASEALGEALPARPVHLASHADRTADRVVDAARRWWSDRPTPDPRPAFLFVHLWDPHYDYAPPPPWDSIFDPDYAGTLDASHYERNRSITAGMPARDLEHLRALYDGEIRWTDTQVAALLGALAGRGDLDHSIVCLVSDHGEEFFEHGRKGHMKSLFEESVRVPWILRHPPRVPAGTVVRGLASLEDVSPTLLELAGLPPLAEATGRSRVPDLEGRPLTERPELLILGGAAALRGPGWKIVRKPGGRSFYYDLRGDPGERLPEPAARVAPEALAALESRLESDRHHADSLRWSAPQSVRLDEATRARLRELGYVEDESEGEGE